MERSRASPGWAAAGGRLGWARHRKGVSAGAGWGRSGRRGQGGRCRWTRGKWGWGWHGSETGDGVRPAGFR
ncbi:hypothetical protein CALVIDRAFT_255632 [Calocera viscosa TUFC12733]|uniref:Uncharacterized protein n=1 Tax=Calocera viscosa (strain TUFC12733) TaxID=1330018 RepID=A0A167J8N0_CALVF|nr:hypothetical protein CALVIDRAFT_255632 [Calocera viscosa TUFC12733]